MTDEEWFGNEDPESMVQHMRTGASDRKLRLFFCALCRSVWIASWPLSIRRAVLASELLADGVISDRDLNQTRSIAAHTTQMAWVNGSRGDATHPNGILEGRFAVALACTEQRVRFRDTFLGQGYAYMFGRDCEMRTQVPSLFLDIFGNPFRPVAFDPQWRTETATALATGIYEERAFDRLPILADALEEAGCDNINVLNHCRGPGPHARGCWAVDLVLGKS